ncbi:ComEA family DNA-binding protein [Marinobacter sp. JSM 1782161]|uniref:ComEA family DNA-binding protein n=1 Tax=Marinobacter sp. JSM 1782161 TaxID=2685906 RepID=UPI001402CCFA|nr:ComEA family DNA-binding protein [Marinobacter sp. JSM 1782161]
MKALITAFFVLATALSNVAVAADTQPAQEAAPTQVNINTADAKTLSSQLDGVGEVKAQAIIDYRDGNGPFASVSDLDKVNGIGQLTLDANRDHITVQ